MNTKNIIQVITIAIVAVSGSLLFAAKPEDEAQKWLLFIEVERPQLAIPSSRLEPLHGEYTFSQERLESNLQGNLNMVTKAIQKNSNTATQSKSEQETIEWGIRVIAYCVIAAGDLGDNTDHLRSLLAEVNALVGPREVPRDISWPEDQFRAMTSVCFTEKKTGDPVDVEIESSRSLFSDLIRAAEKKIEVRRLIILHKGK